MSYHRNPGRASRPYRVSKRSSAMGDLAEWWANLTANVPTTPAPTTTPSSTTWTPSTADQATKQAAGCTPLEIVASPGTTPYLSCEAKLKAKSTPSIWDTIGGIMGGVIGANKPTAPVVVAPASSGISTTTMLVGGVALLGVLYFATKKD